MSPYWVCAQLQRYRESFALECLQRSGYEFFYPRIRERRIVRGRRIMATPPLFPGYCFLRIVLGWHRARWTPGVCGLIKSGTDEPAHVPDAVIEDIRKRERNGFVMLPRRELAPGARVRVTRGPFTGQLALYAGMAPHERVVILLALFGGAQRVQLPADDIAAV
jgi:transcriptional antiterminator RfaH